MSGFTRDTNPSKLGGGVRGGRPEAGFSNTFVGGNVSTSRRILRKAFKSNDVYNDQSYVAKATCGPFRAANNGGDVLSRFNLSCGASNQINRARGQLGGLRLNDGVGNFDCSNITNGVTPKEVKLASSNIRKVYDSSDYIRFKKLEANNKTYNDASFGGDQHNGSYSFLKRLR